MDAQNEKLKPTVPTLLLWSIMFLFFFQLLTEFVEGIYLYGLLGTDIPPEIGLVVLFLVPFLLFFSRKSPSDTWIKLLGSLGLAARCIEIFLPTQGRMIVSGLGMAGFLLFLPAVFSLNRSKDGGDAFSHRAGIGLAIAVVAQILFRALHSGSDLSAYGGYRIIAAGLGILGLVILWGSAFGAAGDREIAAPAKRSTVLGYSLGVFGVLVLSYFAFTAPNVVARWAGVSKFSVFIVLLASWVTGIWWFSQKRISRTRLFVFGLLLVIMMVLAIWPHQIAFPADMNAGYPLLEPKMSFIQIVPLYLMLILSPVLVLIFIHYLAGILEQQPKIRLFAGSFGLGGLFLLMMVLSQVFTTVYDYIPVIGPFFRDKYWLVFLVPGLVAVLPLLLRVDPDRHLPPASTALRKIWLLTSGIMALAAMIGLAIGSANPSPPTAEPVSLRVFTYNIQQGYNDIGERNFDGQVELIKSTNPDIVGLQESDTARIAGGNADVVGYFADRLEMYSYYGPSPITGTFGIALLSKYPIQNPHTYYVYSKGEQVAVIEAEITAGSKTHKVYVTHLGNGGPIFQIRQMLEIMRGQQNVIAMGDFNFRPYEEQYSITTAEYNDAFVIAEEKVAPTTWGQNDTFEIEERIDHVFLSPGIPVLYAEYFTQPESDHPGLFVELAVE